MGRIRSSPFQQPLADEGEVGRLAELAIENGVDGQRGELRDERTHVPGPTAADAELAPAADERAEAVPLELVGVGVSVGEAEKAPTT
jgi:hypothetical protein